MLRKAHAQENAQFLNRMEITLDATNDDAVEAYFKIRIREAVQQRNRIKAVLDGIEALKNKYQSYREAVKQWLASHGEKHWPVPDISEKTEEVCDCVLRFKAFKLATHYWEPVGSKRPLDLLKPMTRTQNLT